MKEFILTNYKELIFLICFIIELVFLIIGIFKKAKKGSSLYADILSMLPVIISKAEKVFGLGHGNEKLNFVIGIINKLFVNETGSVMTSSDDEFFRNSIEKILSTPQKKEK